MICDILNNNFINLKIVPLCDIINIFLNFEMFYLSY